ncbi:imelysin family protein [Frigidibacter mobilis]|uniref:imelysin family protein n=1 Tax=Frigidibacter mobilis TaxID=1335048 RepID=UPI001412F9FD|nr:imelysin family protein [Frigidibacter mobilis]
MDRVVTGTILPRFAAFAQAAAALDTAAADDCLATSPELRAAWNAAFDAWIPASSFRIGPLEQGGRGLAVAFWPDPKDSTGRALQALLAGDGTTLASGEAYAEVSVAARGLHALEAMLYDPALGSYTGTDPGCALTRAAAADLAALAAAVEADWRTGFAPLLQTAGAPATPASCRSTRRARRSSPSLSPSLASMPRSVSAARLAASPAPPAARRKPGFGAVPAQRHPVAGRQPRPGRGAERRRHRIPVRVFRLCPRRRREAGRSGLCRRRYPWRPPAGAGAENRHRARA